MHAHSSTTSYLLSLSFVVNAVSKFLMEQILQDKLNNFSYTDRTMNLANKVIIEICGTYVYVCMYVMYVCGGLGQDYSASNLKSGFF